MPAWSAASSPNSAGAIVSVTLATAVQDALAAEAASCRRRAARPPRGRRSRRPDGTAARPTEPSARTTSTSTVGLPRESRISRASTTSMIVFMRVPSPSTLTLTASGGRAGRSTPGSSRPSRNSSDAPPPVEMWVIWSARPCWVTAATESPPPTTTVAPASARSASIRATAFVPCANDGISKTPSGPFQNTVCASDSASTIRSWLALPRSTMCHDAGIFSAGSVLYSVPRVTSLATMTSTGRTTRTPFVSAAAEGSAARRRRGRARPGSCRPPCPGRAGTCWPSRRRGRACRPWSAGCR